MFISWYVFVRMYSYLQQSQLIRLLLESSTNSIGIDPWVHSRVELGFKILSNLTLILSIFFSRKGVCSFYICYIYSNTSGSSQKQTTWTIIRLLSKEQSDQCSYCLQFWLQKMREQTIFLVNRGKSVHKIPSTHSFLDCWIHSLLVHYSLGITDYNLQILLYIYHMTSRLEVK